MSPVNGSDVVQLLMDMDILSRDDVRDVQGAQSDVLTKILLRKRVIQQDDADQAKQALESMLSSANQTRRTQAQTKLYQLITSGLDSRIDTACDQIRVQKERITSRSWPAVVLAAKPEG